MRDKTVLPEQNCPSKNLGGRVFGVFSSDVKDFIVATCSVDLNTICYCLLKQRNK